MKKYQQITWKDDPQKTAPLTAIDADPLWRFHQALVDRAKEKKELGTDQTLWALAVVKSLIEVRLNKPFMVDAIAAFGDDLKTGAYYADGSLPDGETRYSRNPKIASQFMKYRNATGNAAGGDEYKGHILRTSRVKVSNNPTKYEVLSNDLWVTFKNEKGIDGYMRPYLDAWHTMQSFSKADRDNCLDAFRNKVVVEIYTGCVNERSGTAIQTMLAKVAEKTAKNLQRRDLIKEELQPLSKAWGKEDIAALNAAFEQLFAKYQGYTFYENEMKSNVFVINPQSDVQWPVIPSNKHKLKKEVIALLSILSGDTEEEILAKWVTPAEAAAVSPASAVPPASGMAVMSAAGSAVGGTAASAAAESVAGDAGLTAGGAGPAAGAEDVKVGHAPRFRWVPWVLVDGDVGVDAKLPQGQGVTVQILHDTAAFRTKQAKKQPQPAATAAANPAAQPLPTAIKDSKKTSKEEVDKTGCEFFHSKAAVATSASSAAAIVLTPSGLASVSVEGLRVTAEEANLAARLMPSARALLMLGSMGASFHTATQTVGSYVNNTLSMINQLNNCLFGYPTCVSFSILFRGADAKPYLFVSGPHTGKTILVDEYHQSYTPIDAESRTVLLLKDDDTRHVVRVSPAVWEAHDQDEAKRRALLSTFLKGEDDEGISASLGQVRTTRVPKSQFLSADELKTTGVGLCRTQLLSTAELAMAQQHAQNAKMFSLVGADDLQPSAPGSGAGPFASRPPLAKITTEFKDLFTMSVATVEALLEIPKGVAAAESGERKNYNHWLTKYALEGSAHQSCSANLTLANILLFKIINPDSGGDLQTQLMQLMRCFELYETTWIMIAESFAALQATGNLGFPLLADLQVLSGNIQVVMDLLHYQNVKQYPHQLSQFTSLFKAVHDLIASTPALQQGVRACKAMQTSLAVLQKREEGGCVLS